MKIINKLFIALFPLVACWLIPLTSRLYFYFTEGALRQEMYFVFTTSFGHFILNSPPFIVISIYLGFLIRKDRMLKEIYTKMCCILLPITLFSFFWYAKYLLDPLALGFLPFINLAILIPTWLVGIFINNAFKDTRTE